MDNQSGSGCGYGKPPAATQFKKGVSGNPAGRPKGSKSLATIIAQMCSRKITVNIAGKQRKVNMLEAMMMQLNIKAASGDLKAIRQVIALQQIYGEGERTKDARDISQEQDAAVVKRLFERMKKSGMEDVGKEKECK